MKILFLTYDLPFPLDQGGKIRAFHLLKNLSVHHQITLLSFFRQQSQKQFCRHLQPFCQKILLFKRIKAFSLQHFLTSFRTRLPFPVALYWSKEFKLLLQKEINAHPYDLLHFESFYTSLYLDKKINLPQVLGTENIEWQVYNDYAQTQKLPFLKYPMVWESQRIKKFEEKTWLTADLCLAVSQDNASEIEKITHQKVAQIPNGVDLDFFQLRHQPAPLAKTLLFVGNFAYIQNQDAAKFLVEAIFPLIKKEIPDTTLLIVGKNPPPAIKKYASTDILIREDVADIREAYQKASVLVAPIRAGSGTKLKILEALASGLPVVATTIGIEGIRAENEKEILLADDPSAIASQTIRLLKDRALQARLGQSGRKLVEEFYSWSPIVSHLEAAYRQLIYGQN